MKILITGSSGMLGTELCKALGNGNETIGLDVVHPVSTANSPFFFYEASIIEPEELRKVFVKTGPELVIHAAAYTDVDGCELDPGKAYLMNTTGTENVAALSAEWGIPLIFFSTDFIFDGAKKKPYKENDKASPISVYGDTKARAEEYIKANLKQYAIVRTSWLYGRYGRNFVDTILAKARTERLLRVVNDQVGSPTYARDLAKTIAALINKNGINGRDVFQACNSGHCSWYDLAAASIELAGMGGRVSVSPISSVDLGRPAKRPAYSVMDNSRIQKVTGIKLRGWKDALEDYVKNDRF